MAISGVSTKKSSLERLPDKLLGPRASPNRHQCWRLSASLYERRFGVSSPSKKACAPFPTQLQK